MAGSLISFTHTVWLTMLSRLAGSDQHRIPGTGGWRKKRRPVAGYDRPVLLPEHPIETGRLTLRFFAPADFDDLYAYQSRPDVARYLHWHARDPVQVQQALEQQCGETSLETEGDWLTFAVVWREAGRVIGEVGLRSLSREHGLGETGFVFNPGYQGRGPAPA